MHQTSSGEWRASTVRRVTDTFDHSDPDRLIQIGYAVVMVHSALAGPNFLPPQ